MNAAPWRVAAVTAILAGALLAGGCALSSTVTIQPLIIAPGDTTRSANRVEDLVNVGDFPRAIALAAQIEQKPRPTVAELKALGTAELASGRLDDAKRHFRQALALKPYRTDYSEIAWSLSQAENLEKNFAAALEWAKVAIDMGLEIRPWHTSLLEALSGVRVHDIVGVRDTVVTISDEKPSIPRLETRVNETIVEGILDSGAAMTIVSDRLAAESRIRYLGEFRGTFLGLLGEPIEVRFALIETLKLGDIVLRNVPCAVMAGEKMKFLTLNRAPFHIDLLLGASLLREFRLEFDFAKNQATLHVLDPSERAPVADQNLFFMNGKPYVQGTVNKKGWYLFIIDTGSEITYLNSVEVSRWQLQKSFSKMYRGAELQGLGGSTKHGIKIEDVGVGMASWEGIFNDLPLYSSEKSGAIGLVGEDFLQNFRVILDFGAMTLSLEKTHRGK
jgi:tetratricopeptide (TPR) repeat protein